MCRHNKCSPPKIDPPQQLLPPTIVVQTPIHHHGLAIEVSPSTSWQGSIPSVNQYFWVPVAPRPFPNVEPVSVYTWYHPSLSYWTIDREGAMGRGAYGQFGTAPLGFGNCTTTRGVGNPIGVVSCH